VLPCAASSCACVQPVSGVVTVLVAPGKRVEHLGIKVEMIGQIGICTDATTCLNDVSDLHLHHYKHYN
jgi:Vacuolar protein sorting-associated protein 26